MQAVLERSHATWVIILTLILAGFLAIVPMPEWLEVYRPEWVPLVISYWVMALPHRVGLIFAWIVGFFVDVLEGDMLGLNALALALVAYLIINLYRRLRMFTLIQQSAVIGVLIGIHQLLSFWALTVSNQSTAPNLMFMISALTSAVVWPFVFVILRHLRRNFGVS